MGEDLSILRTKLAMAEIKRHADACCRVEIAYNQAIEWMDEMRASDLEALADTLDRLREAAEERVLNG